MAKTDFTDYAEYLKTVAPEVVEEFNKGYEDPHYYFNNVCRRCYAVVHIQGKHNEYHRALSLVLFALGSTMHSIVTMANELGEERNE